jgi:hypothetical protein
MLERVGNNNVHTSFGAHQNACVIGAGTPFFGVKAIEEWN